MRALITGPARVDPTCQSIATASGFRRFCRLRSSAFPAAAQGQEQIDLAHGNLGVGQGHLRPYVGVGAGGLQVGEERCPTGLAQYTAVLQRREALADAEHSAQEAADQTHRFFQAGRESFLADLQATRTYTAMRAQLAAANTQVAMSQIDLFLALGGGWESGRTQASQPGKP